MNLNSHFTADLPEAFTQDFDVGDHHLAVLVQMYSNMFTVVLETEVIVSFRLKLKQKQVWHSYIC